MMNKPVVNLGAGHGGHNHGKVVRHLREKDLNLRIARRADHMLKGSSFCEPFLERETDVYVSFRERNRRSLHAGCSLNISLHHNAYTDETSENCRVFTYSPNDLAKRQAQKFLDNMPARLQPGRWVAHDEMHKGKLAYPGAYAVVMAYTKPVILVEYGFMTNPDDFDFMSSPGYVEAAAETLVLSLSQALTIR